MQKRILIVGGTGRIGSAIVRGLGGRYDLRLTSRSATPADAARGLYRVDVGGSPEALARAARGCHAIVALGAMGGEGEFDDIAYMNIRGAYHVYEAARRAGVPRVVFASTNHVYGERRTSGLLASADWPTTPSGLYAASKVFGEALGRVYAHRYGMSVICLRIGNYPANERPTAHSVARWISPRDMAQIVERSIEVEHLPYGVVNAVSENDERWMDLEGARRLLGYVPEDNGSEILRTLPPAPPQYRPPRTPPMERVAPAAAPPVGPREVLVSGEDGPTARALCERLDGAYAVRAFLGLADGLRGAGLARAVEGADAMVYVAPRDAGEEFEALEHGVIRGAYLACEAARRAAVRRLVVLTDWSMFAGHRFGAHAAGRYILPCPTTLGGAAHVWAEAVAHAYHVQAGLSVATLCCGEVTASDAPPPGREDVWLEREALAERVRAAIDVPSMGYTAGCAVSGGASAWLPATRPHPGA